MTVMPDQKHQGQWFHFSAQGALQPGIKKTKQFSMAVNLTHDKQSNQTVPMCFNVTFHMLSLRDNALFLIAYSVISSL